MIQNETKPKASATAEKSAPKYPNVKVKLVGEDGNAFAIIGRMTRAMRTAGVSKEERDAFIAEATSGDYNHLLATAMKTVEVE